MIEEMHPDMFLRMKINRHLEMIKDVLSRI